MKNHTPTKENCIALDKALKAKVMKPMETMFYWHWHEDDGHSLAGGINEAHRQRAKEYPNAIPAPLVSELGEVLPIKIKKVSEYGSEIKDWFLSVEKRDNGWYVIYTYYYYEPMDTFSFEATTEADARCLCYIYLLENNLA